jgi:hypothetical protein
MLGMFETNRPGIGIRATKHGFYVKEFGLSAGRRLTHGTTYTENFLGEKVATNDDDHE